MDCTCTGCHEACYGHCNGCGDPVEHCNSYQTEGSKYLWGVPESELAAAEQALDDLELTEPEPPATPDAAPPAFDTTGLDPQTVVDLELAEREYRGGLRLAESGLRRMADAVAIAHEALVPADKNRARLRGAGGQFQSGSPGVPNWDIGCNEHSDTNEDNFRRWCNYMDISKTNAYRFLQVSTLFDHSSPRQQKLLEELAPSLLYAAASPSAPAELVDGVKNGNITTHKQYKELEAKYRAAQQENADKDKKLQQVEDSRKTLEKQLNTAEDERAAAAERADYFKQRAEAAESRPVEVVGASPEDIARWKAEGEKAASDRLAAEAAAANADAARARAEAAAARRQQKKAEEALQGRTDHLAAVEAELARTKAQLATATAAAQAATPAAATAPAKAVVPEDGLILSDEIKEAWEIDSIAALAARPLVPCSQCAYAPWCDGMYLDAKIFDHLDELGVSAAQLDCVLDLLTGCTMGKRKETT